MHTAPSYYIIYELSYDHRSDQSRHAPHPPFSVPLWPRHTHTHTHQDLDKSLPLPIYQERSQHRSLQGVLKDSLGEFCLFICWNHSHLFLDTRPRISSPPPPLLLLLLLLLPQPPSFLPPSLPGLIVLERGLLSHQSSILACSTPSRPSCLSVRGACPLSLSFLLSQVTKSFIPMFACSGRGF